MVGADQDGAGPEFSSSCREGCGGHRHRADDGRGTQAGVTGFVFSLLGRTRMPIEGTILLIEDNRDDEALMLRALKRHHAKKDVVVARDGAEGLEYLLGADSKPQLILL